MYLVNNYESSYIGTFLALLLNCSQPANIKLLRELEKSLKENGKIEGHGLHTIRQPVKSEYTGNDVTGWKVAYVSKSDDLRLGYKRHDDNIIEVKFGKASDIGYKH